LITIGIDPGSSGVICILEGSQVELLKLPYIENKLDVAEVSILLHDRKPNKIVIEKPFIMPGNKNKGLISQLTNYGALWAVCEISGCTDVIEVMPRVWKKTLRLGSDKEDSINKAKELNPNINLKLTKRSKVDNHNAAEAYLLAYWATTILKDQS
tara:strand:+ start:3308 stop:3772 length:465 start_codon:yes stop_codon:yes gene_type:complete